MYVKILDIETDEVIETVNKEPITEAKAEKVLNGVNINLNHEKYYAGIFES